MNSIPSYVGALVSKIDEDTFEELLFDELEDELLTLDDEVPPQANKNKENPVKIVIRFDFFKVKPP
jgi:hypothetical protein